MKNSKFNSNYLYLLTAVFLWMGCQKSEFVNLKSTISSENDYLGVEEGDDLILNVNLTEELSEDLTLELKINRDLESGTYINLDDFQNYFSYSADAGKTWIRGTNNEVTVPQRTNNLKIKLETIDDQKLEIHEKFSLEIVPKAGKIFKLTGQIAPKEVTVYDNEIIPESGGEAGAEGLVHNEALLYSRDENNQYELVKINREANFNKVLKKFLDEGPEPKILNDINTLVKAGGIPIKNLGLVFDRTIEWQGYVNNRGINTKEDNWIMGLNLAGAYTKIDEEAGRYVPIEYNEDGSFGYIIVHEFGHILTLNRKNEIEPFVYTEDGLEDMQCDRLSLPGDGCLYENSVLNQFNNLFYLNGTQYNQPRHVTPYATSNIAEDIAETFAFFIGQESINPVTEESSGALRKINYVANRDRIKNIKTPLLGGLSGGKISIRDEQIIRKFNRTPQGKRISCTDYETIWKMTEEAHQKRNQ